MGVLLLLLPFLGLWVAESANDDNDAINDEDVVSYVIEPFDKIADDLVIGSHKDAGALNVSIDNEHAAFGSGALRMEYVVEQTETWGGLVHLASLLQYPSSYMCDGATHISLWYKIIENQSIPGMVELRLNLIDDSHCHTGNNCENEENMEHYYSFHHVLQDGDDSGMSEWKEIRVALRGDTTQGSPFWGTGWYGLPGNGKLDVDRISGWRIELSIGQPRSVGITSEGILLVDQLACVGGSKLFSAPFYTQSTFKEALVGGQWYQRFLDPPDGGINIAAESTETVVGNGTLTVNYTVEQTEVWGGSIVYSHYAPRRAYYNLSKASSVSLTYQILASATPAERMNLRLVLHDSSHCEEDCDTGGGKDLEHYYSFHHILDDPVGLPSQVSVELVGDGNNTSPFWRTGWAGAVGNDILDPSTIKGFTFDFSMNAEGESGSRVSGGIRLSNLIALASSTETNNNRTSDCIIEPTIYYTPTDSWRKVPYLVRGCCDACQEDVDCEYGTMASLISDASCYMTPSIDAENIHLSSTEQHQAKTQSFWIDDIAKRGDFCEKCMCRESDQTIDCYGKNLTIVPKTFSPSNPFSVRVLDLRNTSLVMIGLGSLDEISESLEELRLPTSLAHLSKNFAQNMDSLQTVVIEEEEAKAKDVGSGLTNVITESSGFFANVCCGRGSSIDLKSPADGLTFCDMNFGHPGVDAIYEPFVDYRGADVIQIITPSSTSLSEAADSVEACAEFCHMHPECRYFTYDARVSQTQTACHFLLTMGTPTMVCCDRQDFADRDMTIPGLISGRVPRTRQDVDNARVLVNLDEVALDESNGYKSILSVSLGSMPTRGAVWIKPRLSYTSSINITTSPNQVALYDNKTQATIEIAVLDAVEDINRVLTVTSTVMIMIDVESCDDAFSITPDGSGSTTAATIYFEVIPSSGPTNDTEASKLRNIILVIIVVAVIMVTGIAIFMYRSNNNNGGVDAKIPTAASASVPVDDFNNERVPENNEAIS